jgi:hypothetical protein
MAGVSPGDALNHLNQWDRAAIQVVALQNLAERANPPGWRVEPVPPIPGRVIREKESRSGRAGTATPPQVDKDTARHQAPDSVKPLP